MPNENTIFLDTGIDTLNRLLAIGVDKPGLLISLKKDGHQETPVVIISGASGTGKTTLALQIAFNAAAQDYYPCYYSLEQSPESLNNIATNFGYFLDAIEEKESEIQFCNLEDELNFNHEILDCHKKIHLCHFSPRPISDVNNKNVFEQRLAELHHITDAYKESLKHPRNQINGKKNGFPIFFIDSLNSFSSTPLERNEIHRLFTLFRNNHIPVIFTMEHPQNYIDGSELTYLECAKFLSDVSISLTKESTKGYLQYYLEIEKSRMCLQGLGKHLYKIRTKTVAQQVPLDPRTGIVLYRSMHSVLSDARRNVSITNFDEIKICDPLSDADFKNPQFNDNGLYRIINTDKVKKGKCLSIIGPQGTHKLALGINIAMGSPINKNTNEEEHARLLVVNFGSSGDFEFRNVAWVNSRKDCRNLQKKDKGEGNQVKFWKTDYLIKKETNNKDGLLVTFLTFKIGSLAPEECFNIIDKVILNAECGCYSSVLLSDTAELCNGFPMLVSDPLFLPALIDLFTEYGLFTICIGVDTKQPGLNTDINFALSSRADYRINTYHHPSTSELLNVIVDHNHQDKEQDVCVIIDDVYGKHYKRAPIWLKVDSKGENENTLLCIMDKGVKVSDQEPINPS